MAKPRKHCDKCGRNYLTEVITARQMTVFFKECPWCDGSIEETEPARQRRIIFATENWGP